MVAVEVGMVLFGHGGGDVPSVKKKTPTYIKKEGRKRLLPILYIYIIEETPPIAQIHVKKERRTEGRICVSSSPPTNITIACTQ